jgi:hypothetical protein
MKRGYLRQGWHLKKERRRTEPLTASLPRWITDCLGQG